MYVCILVIGRYRRCDDAECAVLCATRGFGETASLVMLMLLVCVYFGDWVLPTL